MDILVKELYSNPKRYYTIGEVAAMFEVSQSLIRFWEGEFPSLRPSKNRKGDRLFTIKNIDHLRLIYHLVKEKGYTLEGARNEISSKKSKEDKKQTIIQELVKAKELLLKLHQDL